MLRAFPSVVIENLRPLVDRLRELYGEYVHEVILVDDNSTDSTRSVIESLRPEDVRLVVEPTEDGPASPRLSLPPATQGRVELVSTTPTQFNFDR